MIEDILLLCVYAGIVYWCAWIAQKKHRNVPLAAFWATLFGIFAVLVYYTMDVLDVIDEKDKNQQQEENN